MYELPWQINASLSRENIVEVASLLSDVRGEVIDLHDEILGDTRLSLGMRAYECCRSRIIAESKSGAWPWLSILTSTGRFTFMIGKTPVRFVRNDPDQLPSDKLIPSEETKIQMNLFTDSDPYADIVWFFVIDTFYKNPADNAYFIGYNKHGEIISRWDIPLENKATPLAAINDVDEITEVSKASIMVKSVTQKNISNDE